MHKGILQIKDSKPSLLFCNIALLLHKGILQIKDSKPSLLFWGK